MSRLEIALVRRAICAALALIPFARALAQVPPDTAHRPRVQGAGATVSGVVYDSIARAPMAGAIVQIVKRGDMSAMGIGATSDSAGRFRIDDVPVGQYVIGFFHPMIDSLGIEPPLRALDVVDSRPVRMEIGLPSPERFRTAMCGARAAGDSSALLFGIVRDARTLLPIDSVPVTAQWVELRFGQHGFEQHAPRFTATSRRNGWYAFCGVPSRGTLGVFAVHDADSTGDLEVEAPASRVLRRDLFVGPSHLIADTTRAAPADSGMVPLPPSARGVRTGDATLGGIVVASAGGRPLAGAHVAIEGGPQATANDRGEWTIGNAPPGTRMVDIRAVGYYPERRPVDVFTGTPRLRTSLSTLKAVMDTVKVTAQRLYNRDRNGFQQRSQRALGRFITEADIEKRHPITTSDLFHTMPSVRVARTSAWDSKILMRGNCVAAIFIDGMSVRDLTVADIDAWVQPQDITGIEVYTQAETPPQYQTMNGCGSILIWTK
jgi:hypothetical protein